MNETQICIRALRISSPAERAAYLDRACAADSHLRSRIEAQLQEVEQTAENFSPLQSEASTPTPGSTPPTGAIESLKPPTRENTGLARFVPGKPAGDALALPGYAIDSELGRGGMGVVYKAVQKGLNRAVALKMMLRADRADEKTLIRFLSEAEAVASIRHPNVVQVYEYGEHAGHPFLAMEFCPHGTLSGKLKAGRLEPRAAAALVERLARAIQVAHEMGIVHRDLKPANVLFDADDEAKIADFGLAKRTNRSDLTGTGTVLGTPAYMSPEQAKGQTKFVGPAADIWAIGVILYECLSGERPFDGEDPWSVLQQVINQEPTALRTRVRKLPSDVVTICGKCLAKNPKDRYPNAHELAEDLQRFLTGAPVLARSTPVWEVAWKWGRRHPAETALLAFAVVVVIGSVATFLSWREIRHRHEIEQAEVQHQKELGEADLRRQREVNELTFRDYQKTVDAITSIGKNLKNTPGAQRVQMQLFAEVRNSYNRFRDRWLDKPTMEAELARNQYHLGDSLLEIGQKNEAFEEYKEAIRIQQRLFDVREDDPSAERDLAKTQLSLGRVLAAIGDRSASLTASHQCREHFEHLISRADADPDDRTNLGTAMSNIGYVLDEAGKLSDALTWYDRARAIRLLLVDTYPRRFEFKQDLAQTENNIGTTLQRAGQLKKAIEAYNRSLAIRKSLADVDRTRTDYKFDMAVCQFNIGLIHLDSGLSFRRGEARDPKLGARSLEDATNILTKLANENREVPEYRHLLAKCSATKLLLDAESLPLQKAQELFSEAREILERSIEDGTDVPESTQLLGNCYMAMATLEDDATMAEQSLSRARELFAGLAKKYIDNPDYECDVGWSLRLLANVQAKRGETGEATKTCENALKQQRMALDTAPEIIRFRRELTSTYAILAGLQRTLGQVDQAIASTTERMNLWDDRDELYDSACDFGRSMIAAEVNTVREIAASKALECLERAVKNGFSDWDRVRQEKDFVLLRMHPEFAAAFKRLQGASR